MFNIESLLFMLFGFVTGGFGVSMTAIALNVPSFGGAILFGIFAAILFAQASFCFTMLAKMEMENFKKIKQTH